jgi:hypothetical protein
MMANVSYRWIRENVEDLSFGGQIDKDNLREHVKIPRGGFQTTLTRRGIEAVEDRAYDRKFNILVPGSGWADCFSYAEGEDDDPISRL